MPSRFGIDLAPFVDPDRVLLVEHALGKAALLARLIERTSSHPAVTDPAAFTKAIYDREEVTSTGIGTGVAVPHARLPSIRGFALSLAVAPYGIAYGATDDRPVHVVVMLAAPDHDHQHYLKVLASVALRLKQPGLVDRMRQLTDPMAITATFLG